VDLIALTAFGDSNRRQMRWQVVQTENVKILFEVEAGNKKMPAKVLAYDQ
jgi:hypothetical protein